MEHRGERGKAVEIRKERSIYRISGQRTAAGILLFAAAFLLLAGASCVPGFAQWYSVNVYSFCVATVGRFFGIFAFSASEYLLYIFLVFLLYEVVKTAAGVVRTKTPGFYLASFFSGLFLAAGILFFLYAAFCGVNYHRNSFAQESGLEWKGATREQLKEVCEELTAAVNRTGKLVERDDRGVMIVTEDVSVQAVNAMEKLSDEYSCLKGYYPQPNGLLFSWILSVQQLTGIYSPFTIEANYNTDMEDYNIPFTACHELAHLRGFMQEEEANFIGFLAGIHSDSISFNYSSYMLGWINCMNTLYLVDEEAYSQVREELSDEAEADLKADRMFWARYDSPVAEAADRINDSYLKANGQEDGVESYDRMVELILTYYNKGNL